MVNFTNLKDLGSGRHLEKVLLCDGALPKSVSRGPLMGVSSFAAASAVKKTFDAAQESLAL